MIEFREGNLLEADAEALVNTVNTVGVMGKGIALQFKKKFPENFKAYKQACDEKEVKIGKMFVFSFDRLSNPRYIINFPTKNNWREKSRLEYVREGLDDLVREVRELGIHSMAVPPLGCGNGGLDWEEEVRPLMEGAFARIPDVAIYAYEPTLATDPIPIESVGPKPHLTVPRAAMLRLIAAYKASHYDLGRLVAQKLAYLAQIAGEDSFNLDFKEAEYGPYADKLRFLLQTLNGHHIIGLGDFSNKSDIELAAGAEQEAESFLSEHPETQERLERVIRLMEGFETPYGMELLATVHWAATRKNAATPEDATQIVRDWTARKSNLFGEDHIRVTWERLEDEGWLAMEPIVHS
jgi:O-acetyl-ADP-ribose deacetylase (regulator of RNase III)